MTGFRRTPGESYRPANGTEGEIFMSHFCEKCKKDGYTDDTPEKGCQILAFSMAYEIGDPDYPAEWVYDKDGLPTCTAFEEEK